jgi:hypothetical protein
LALVAAVFILPLSYFSTKHLIELPALYAQGVFLVLLVPTLVAVWAQEKRRRSGDRYGRRPGRAGLAVAEVGRGGARRAGRR